MLLSNDIYAAIGRVTANFQMLEAAIMMTTGALISPDAKVGQIVTSQLSFDRLCTTLDGLIRHRVPDPELHSSLTAALTKASDAEQRRNTILHSIYLGPEEPGRPGATRAKITVRRGKGLKRDMTPVDAASIDKVAGEILEAWDEFVKIMTALESRGLVTFPAG